MKMSLFSALALVFAGFLTAAGAGESSDRLLLVHPDQPNWPGTLRAVNGRMAVFDDYIETRFSTGVAGAVELFLDVDGLDWSGYEGLSHRLFNAGNRPLTLYIRVESLAPDGRPMTSRRMVVLPANASVTLPFFFTHGNAGPYWGMRGIPVYNRLAQALFSAPEAAINLSRVVRAALEVDAAAGPVRLRVLQVALFRAGSPLAELAPYPFIDEFGQYKHADWPGKIKDIAALEASSEEETEVLRTNPFPVSLDAFGGWLDGPKQKGTGWFRVEQVDGRWWFVTPEGHLFLSMGVNCVHYGDATFVEGRDRWFENLPAPDGEHAAAYGHVSGVHSLAEAIGGSGRTLNHYRLNLMRKYGEDYREKARHHAYKRLAAWGFNTIGNWSDRDIIVASPLPFTITAGSGAARAIEASEGYWGKMKDVYDPAFAVNTDTAIAGAVTPFRDDPRVLGIFVDNELSLSGIAPAALHSPLDQPSRMAFIELLGEKYGTVAELNKAWECDTGNWESLRMPQRPNANCRADCAEFEYRFARRYFDTVAAALHRHAPNHLYLGCRLTPMYCPPAVLKACAEVADVVSLNVYSQGLSPDRYLDLDKPVIIGEFHFGALDRGMFHTGLQSAGDQEERAGLYGAYVESIARHDAAVGAHWFQYMDQPTTGRTLDGENYNIGLVSIADVSYPELTRGARDIHTRMYRMRLGPR